MEIGGWLARDTIGRLGLGASDSVILLTYMYMRVACRRRVSYVRHPSSWSPNRITPVQLSIGLQLGQKHGFGPGASGQWRLPSFAPLGAHGDSLPRLL